MIEHRYSPWEHASRARVGIHWHAKSLPPGADHAYVPSQETLILRPNLALDRLTAAAATGLAERDLIQRGPQFGTTSPEEIAAHRLIPLADLLDAIRRHRGGVTAVARALGVPTTLVMRRLFTLGPDEARAIDLAAELADPSDSRAVGRVPTIPLPRPGMTYGPADTLVMHRAAG